MIIGKIALLTCPYAFAPMPFSLCPYDIGLRPQEAVLKAQVSDIQGIHLQSSRYAYTGLIPLPAVLKVKRPMPLPLCPCSYDRSPLSLSLCPWPYILACMPFPLYPCPYAFFLIYDCFFLLSLVELTLIGHCRQDTFAFFMAKLN